MEILGYLALLFVGLMLGTFGGGGAILSVPILVYLFSLDTVTSTAYSLFIVGNTSLVGSILKYRTQMVDFRTVILFGIPSLAVIFITRNWIIPNIPEVLLITEGVSYTKRGIILSLFALFMILSAKPMIAQNWSDGKRQVGRRVFLIPAGMITGLLTGLVGAGGGFIIILVLLYFTSLPYKTIVGTTLTIISVNSLFGFTGDVLNRAIDWPFLLLITGLAVTGILLAGQLTRKIANEQLQVAFGWFVLFMGLSILLQEFTLM